MWRRRQREEKQPTTTGYRVPAVPIVAEVPLREARRGHGGERLFTALMGAIALLGATGAVASGQLHLLPIFGAWAVYSAHVFGRAMHRVRHLRVRGDGLVEVRLRRKARRGRLWLERKPLFGTFGEHRAWELRLGLEGEHRPLDVVRGDLLPKAVLATLEGAAVSDEEVAPTRFAFGALPAKVPAGDALPAAQAPLGALRLRAHVRLWRGRGVPAIVPMMPLIAASAATGSAVTIALLGLGSAVPALGSAAAMALSFAGALAYLGRTREIALERKAGVVIVRSGGEVLARLRARPHALVPTVVNGELRVVHVLDGGGVEALEVPKPTPEVAAALRALFAASGPRVRVAARAAEAEVAAVALPAPAVALRQRSA